MMRNSSFLLLAILMAALQVPVSAVYKVSEDVFKNFTKNCGLVNSQYNKHDESGDIPYYARIVGGTFATSGSWPWMVAIEFLDEQVCGGAIIGPRHILTAAHCLLLAGPENSTSKLGPLEFSVLTGVTNLNYQGTPDKLGKVLGRKYNVSETVVHDKFFYNNVSIVAFNDIGIIVLTKDIELNEYTVPICLPPDDVKDDQFIKRYVMGTGWGLTKFNESETDRVNPEKLREVPLVVLSNKLCTLQHPPGRGYEYFSGAKEQMCVGPRIGTDKGFCSGDSGGPVVMKTIDDTNNNRWMQVGVLVGGINCTAGRDNPAITMRVTSYLDWIMEQIVNLSQKMDMAKTTPTITTTIPTNVECICASAYSIEPCLYFTIFFSIIIHHTLHFLPPIYNKWIFL